MTNYSRCLARMALHFNCNPLELDEDQVLDYLYHVKTQSCTPSSSYFKHTVYELRFAYRVMGIQQKQVFLSKMKLAKKRGIQSAERYTSQDRKTHNTQLITNPGLGQHQAQPLCCALAERLIVMHWAFLLLS